MVNDEWELGFESSRRVLGGAKKEKTQPKIAEQKYDGMWNDWELGFESSRRVLGTKEKSVMQNESAATNKKLSQCSLNNEQSIVLLDSDTIIWQK